MHNEQRRDAVEALRPPGLTPTVFNVMRRMGHSSITVTYNRYAKLFPEKDGAITEGLEALFDRATATPPTPGEVVPLRK